jgi:YHS domain-containing protein
MFAGFCRRRGKEDCGAQTRRRNEQTKRQKQFKIDLMKQFNRIVTSLIIAGLTLAVTALVSAARADTSTNAPVKPDQLTTCPVSGEKLGEMGKPYVFTYQGQEVKLCCSGCKKDFDKDPAKYLKKIREADAAAKK